MANVFDTYAEAGISVVPLRRDGSKAPAVKTWQQFQKEVAEGSLRAQWHQQDFGIGIIGGPISGGLEVIDLDERSLLEPFREEVERLAPGLFDRLPVVKTPRGAHVYLRSENPAGNQKLAMRPDGVDEKGRPRIKTLIETRGAGGYVVAPGSPVECHSSRLPYVHVGGPPIVQTPLLSASDREILFLVAASFNQVPVEPEHPAPHQGNGKPRQGLAPGDDLNQRASWEEILEPHGWTKVHESSGTTKWRRPGKEVEGCSATTGVTSQNGTDLFCVFSSNAHPFPGPTASKTCSSHSKFDAYTILNHDGDHKAAARALGQKGYGDKPDRSGQRGAATVTKGGEITFECRPGSRKGTLAITARRGDEVLHIETLDPTRSKAREDFVKAVTARRDDIDPELVRRELMRIAAGVQHSEEEQPEVPGEPTPEELLAEMPPQVRAAARRMLEDPNLAKRIIDDVASLGVAGERELIAAIYLIGTSRLLPRPLAGIVQSQSSSGKSHVIDKTSLCFPPEAIIFATAMTPQSLYHMKPGSLSHRFVVAGEPSRIESDETAEASRALREMLSSGKLSKLLPVKEGNEIVTKRLEQAGPITYIESTTLTKIFDEDANRCILLATDEREQQTRLILLKLAGQSMGASDCGDPEITIAKHHALQRMLQRRTVVVPYAQRLADGFSTHRVEARRAFPHLLSMIQASAMLHQFQRQMDQNGRIIASPEDYQIARRLMAVPVARSLGGRISNAAIRFHERLVESAAGMERFTTTDAVKRDQASDRAVRGWLRELAEAGVVEQVEDGRGNKPAVWRLTGARPEELGNCDLPAVESIVS